MPVELGKGGYIQKLETSFKSANFEKDGLFVIYSNKFVSDVIGSNMVSTNSSSFFINNDKIVI